MEEKDLFTSYNIKHIIALILATHKQPKEAIHLSLKVKDGVKTYHSPNKDLFQNRLKDLHLS